MRYYSTYYDAIYTIVCVHRHVELRVASIHSGPDCLATDNSTRGAAFPKFSSTLFSREYVCVREFGSEDQRRSHFVSVFYAKVLEATTPYFQTENTLLYPSVPSIYMLVCSSIRSSEHSSKDLSLVSLSRTLYGGVVLDRWVSEVMYVCASVCRNG